MTPPPKQTKNRLPPKISALDLFNILPTVNPLGFLCLIDMRSKGNFDNAHITQAINFPFPPPPENGLAALIDEFFERELSGKLFEVVVFYDATGKYDQKDLWDLTVLMQDKLCLSKSAKILEGGFAEFLDIFPFVCVPTGRDFVDKTKRFPSIIVPNFLYLGGYECTDPDVLAHLGITFIQNLASECENKGAPGCNYNNFKLLDTNTEDIVAVFEEAFKFIDEARHNNKRILLHCRHGVSRSSTIVIGYLMKTKKWSLQDSLRFVTERRAIVFPNAGFKKQLQLYEQKLKDTGEMYNKILNIFE